MNLRKKRWRRNGDFRFLPVNVIGELVGVPRSDWNYFRPLVNDGVANLEASPTLEELKASHAAFTEMGEYFRQLYMKEKRIRKTI